MTDVDNKKESFPCLSLPNTSLRKGARDVVVDVAEGGGAAAVAILYSVYQAPLPAGAAAGRRVRLDRGPADRHAHAVDDARALGRPGRRPLQRLSPRLVPRPLVPVAAGPGPGGDGAGAGAAGAAGGLRRGRHRNAAPRRARVRQGTPSRRLPLDAHVQGVALGAPLGGTGDQREVPVCQACVVAASPGGAVPHEPDQRAGGAPAQAGDPTGPPADRGAVALVPRATLHSA